MEVVQIKKENLETVVKWMDTLSAPHNQVLEAQKLLLDSKEIKEKKNEK